jgi:hypothetical protein
LRWCSAALPHTFGSTAAVWPDLPTHIKAAVLALVGTGCGPPSEVPAALPSPACRTPSPSPYLRPRRTAGAGAAAGAILSERGASEGRSSQEVSNAITPLEDSARGFLSFGFRRRPRGFGLGAGATFVATLHERGTLRPDGQGGIVK